MLEEISPELSAYQENKLITYQEANARVEEGGVVFIGDSLIDFFSLKKFLGRDLPLINRGIAGTDSVWLLEHIESQIGSLQPAKLFILIGTNDLGQGFDISAITERLSQIIIKVRKASYNSQIYLLSLLPVNERPIYRDRVKVRRNATIIALNQKLESLPGATFIDLYSCLLDQDGHLAAEYTTDGLHLSQSGYAKISQVLQLYLP